MAGKGEDAGSQDFFLKEVKSWDCVEKAYGKVYSYVCINQEKFLVKKKRVTQFPRFYQPLKRVDLSKGFFHSTPQLEYIQPLLQLVSKCPMFLTT